MNCQEAKKGIYIYLDEQLASVTEHALYQHLSVCSACKREINRVRELNCLLESCLTPVEPPPGLVAGVMQRLEYNSAPGKAMAQSPVHRKGILAWASHSSQSLRAGRGWLVAGFLALFLGSSSYWLSKDGVNNLIHPPEASFSPAQLAQAGETTLPAKESSPGEVTAPVTLETTSLETKAAGQNDASQGTEEKENAASTIGNNQEPSGGNSDQPIKEPAPKSEPSTGTGANQGQPSSHVDKAAQPPEKQQPVGQLPAQTPGGVMPTGKLEAAGLGVSNEESPIHLSPLLADGSWDYREPVWTPDGQQLLFFSQREAQADLLRLWSMSPDVRTSELVKGIDSLPLIQGGGAWALTGDRVAYVQNRQGHLEIWLQTPESRIRNLTPAPATSLRAGETDFWAYWPVWSPRGELAYLTTRFGGLEDVMLLNPDGGERALTKTPGAREIYPVWSPDGDYLAFYRTEKQNGSRQDRIFTIRRDGSGERAITGDMGGDVMVPVWSPDGGQLAINIGVSEPRTDLAVRRPGLWLVNKDGSGLRRLASGGGTLVKWSPDGKSIAYTDGSGLLYLVNLQVGTGLPEVVQVTTQGDVEGLTWSLNSRQLIFDWAKAGGKRGLWVADLNGQMN